MKKNICKSLVFFLMLFLSLIIVNCIIPQKTGRILRQEGYLRPENKDLDIVAVGNSDLYSGYIPSIIYEEHGYRSYNCGLSQIKLEDIYANLVDVFKHQKPSLIILETDVVCYVPSEKSFINQSNAAFRIYDFHDFWRRADFKEIVDMKGYVYSNDHGFYGNKDYMSTNAYNPISEIGYMWLDKIVDLCNENNAEILMVEFLSGTTWSNQRHEEVKKYADSKNIKFLDFNVLEDANTSIENDFRDEGNHLNVYGAYKATKYIGNYIKNNYNIKKHKDKDESFELASTLFKQKIERDNVVLE